MRGLEVLRTDEGRVENGKSATQADRRCWRTSESGMHRVRPDDRTLPARRARHPPRSTKDECRTDSIRTQGHASDAIEAFCSRQSLPEWWIAGIISRGNGRSVTSYAFAASRMTSRGDAIPGRDPGAMFSPALASGEAFSAGSLQRR
jgi:hypothetical protein